jgi:transcriptional regulator with XRE-family HTH domain
MTKACITTDKVTENWPLDKKIGKRMKKCREICNLTQSDMADYLNTAVRTYRNYEYGLSECEFSTLIEIADKFDVDLDYLLCRTDIPNTSRKLEDSLISQYQSFIRFKESIGNMSRDIDLIQSAMEKTITDAYSNK